MRRILDRFYPGFFGQTHIVGLNRISNFAMSTLFARETSSSKWRRQWQLSRPLSEVEQHSTHIITCMSQQSLPVSEHGGSTPPTTAPTSPAPTSVLLTLARAGRLNLGDGNEEIEAAGPGVAPLAFYKLLPPRKSWYKRTIKRKGYESLEVLVASGNYVIENGLIFPTEGPVNRAGDGSSRGVGTTTDDNRAPPLENGPRRESGGSDPDEEIPIQLNTGVIVAPEARRFRGETSTRRRRNPVTEQAPTAPEPSNAPRAPIFSGHSSDSLRKKTRKNAVRRVERATRAQHFEQASRRLDGRSES